jgi:hypothetical protein
VNASSTRERFISGATGRIPTRELAWGRTCVRGARLFELAFPVWSTPQEVLPVEGRWGELDVGGASGPCVLEKR